MTIIVCGAGTMGSGIAENSARAGFKTILFDLSVEVLARAEQSIEKSLLLQVEKNKISGDERQLILSRLNFTTDMSQCSGDIIIEAIIENLPSKVALYRRMSELNGPEVIFASNTSSLSIAAIADQLPHPERVCGMHFFNPAQVMKLVEVVISEHTAPWVNEKITALARSMGKEPVTCKDSPGFIVNRVARHYYLESLTLLEEGIGNISQIDELLENTGFKMGPFRLMDLIGNDINYAVTSSLYEACGKPLRFRPSVIQQDKVDRGELGRKTGKGYYTY
jgi:3-hydroxybutyryl-CoA dehydrogenase